MFHLSPSSILCNGTQAHKAVTWPFSFNQRESYLSAHYTCSVERSATAIHTHTHTHTHTHVQRRQTPRRRAPRSKKETSQKMRKWKGHNACLLNFSNWKKKASFGKTVIEMKTSTVKSIIVFDHKYVPGLFTLPMYTNTRNVPKAV
jgi:hypothetical protein